MSDGDALFLIDGGVVHTDHHPHEIGAQEALSSDSPHHSASAQAHTRAASGDHTHGADAVDSGAEAHEKSSAASVTDLIPLCVQHASGPKRSTAVFGYDIAQMEKRPWNEPGVNLSDYFNYGFNETSWRLYCMMQKDGAESLLARANEVLRRLEQHAGVAEGRRHGEREGEGGERDSNSRYGHGGNARRHNYYNTNNHTNNNNNMNHSGSTNYSAGVGAGRSYNAGVNYTSANAAAPRSAMTAGATHHSSYKTRLCQRFMEGRCARGAECNYAHGVDELRSMPPTNQANNTNSNRSNTNNAYNDNNNNNYNDNRNENNAAHSGSGNAGSMHHYNTYNSHGAANYPDARVSEPMSGYPGVSSATYPDSNAMPPYPPHTSTMQRGAAQHAGMMPAGYTMGGEHANHSEYPPHNNNSSNNNNNNAYHPHHHHPNNTGYYQAPMNNAAAPAPVGHAGEAEDGRGGGGSSSSYVPPARQHYLQPAFHDAR